MVKGSNTILELRNISIERHGLAFRYLLVCRSGPDLIVFFPSLRSDPSSNPCYHRIDWHHAYPWSCLYVADPGVTEQAEPRGTWFQGRPDCFGAERIAADIVDIAEQFDLSRERTILYGSSHGGFGALATAAYLRGAQVLAECPQIDARWALRADDVNAMAKACYGVENAADIDPGFNVRLDIAELYHQREAHPTGRILVRASDTRHVDIHLAHFRRRLPNTLREWIVDDSRNPLRHWALPRALITREFKRMLA